jgi:hypothetical protein
LQGILKGLVVNSKDLVKLRSLALNLSAEVQYEWRSYGIREYYTEVGALLGQIGEHREDLRTVSIGLVVYYKAYSRGVFLEAKKDEDIPEWIRDFGWAMEGMYPAHVFCRWNGRKARRNRT